jgi:hypothetical protein
MSNTTPAREGTDTVTVTFDRAELPPVVRAEYDGIFLRGDSFARPGHRTEEYAEIAYIVERITSIANDGRDAEIVEIVRGDKEGVYLVTVERPQ